MAEHILDHVPICRFINLQILWFLFPFSYKATWLKISYPIVIMRHYALWFGLSAFTSSTASPIAFFSTDSITSEQTIDNSIPSSDVFPVVATETTDETQSDEADAFIDNYNVPDSGRNKDWIIAGAGAEKLTVR